MTSEYQKNGEKRSQVMKRVIHMIAGMAIGWRAGRTNL